MNTILFAISNQNNNEYQLDTNEKQMNLESEVSTKISFQICNEIAVPGNSFTEGDFIKKCLMSAVSIACPYKRSVLENT
ncbi:hypothetical protein PR048_014620, partial [Dryococelus australis]